MNFEFAPWEKYDASVQDGPADFSMEIAVDGQSHNFLFKNTSRACFFRLADLNGPFCNFAMPHNQLQTSNFAWTNRTSFKPVRKGQLSRAIARGRFVRFLGAPQPQISPSIFFWHDATGRGFLSDTQIFHHSGDVSQSDFCLDFLFPTPRDLGEWLRSSSQVSREFLLLQLRETNSQLSQLVRQMRLSDEEKILLLLQTQRETPQKMVSHLQAALRAIHPFWEGEPRATLEWRLMCVTKQFTLREQLANTPRDLHLPVRERTLFGKILRYYGVEVAPESPQDSWFVTRLRSQWLAQPHFTVSVEAPTFHERLEALAVLQPLLQEIWPEGAKHFEKIV